MRRLVAEARVATLATIVADGRPQLVPVTFAVADDTLYTAVDDKPKRTRALARLANIERDPRVTVLVHHYDDDWSGLWWVRIDGRGRLVSKGAELDHAIAALRVKYEPYRGSAPAGPVIAVEAEAWTGWTASGRG